MLADVQNWPDARGIGLDEVGINGVRYPVAIFDTEHGKQDIVATVSLSASLPQEQKGSHLSRFMEILDAHAGELTPSTIPGVLLTLQERLESTAARLQMSFPYFLRRRAPVSGASALIDYDCGFTASVRRGEFKFLITARVPVTSVCPCSKAVSDYGAHNQRSHITISAEPTVGANNMIASVWMEDLIDTAEAAASSPVFPLLKRADERHVTMNGYDHPVFVEDMVRGVTERLRADSRIARFTVEAASEESIHNHGAFARLAWPPEGSGDDQD